MRYGGRGETKIHRDGQIDRQETDKHLKYKHKSGWQQTGSRQAARKWHYQCFTDVSTSSKRLEKAAAVNQLHWWNINNLCHTHIMTCYHMPANNTNLQLLLCLHINHMNVFCGIHEKHDLSVNPLTNQHTQEHIILGIRARGGIPSMRPLCTATLPSSSVWSSIVYLARQISGECTVWLISML